MGVCNSTIVGDYFANMGTRITNNLFFLEDHLWIEILEEKQYVSQYTGNVVVHRLVQSSSYLAWNYKIGTRHYSDAKTFRTQLTLFKYFKERREGYMDSLMEELLNYDLCDLAIRSEHLY
jgi:hypothetical protein